jgi:hypothetical protein
MVCVPFWACASGGLVGKWGRSFPGGKSVRGANHRQSILVVTTTLDDMVPADVLDYAVDITQPAVAADLPNLASHANGRSRI